MGRDGDKPTDPVKLVHTKSTHMKPGPDLVWRPETVERGVFLRALTQEQRRNVADSKLFERIREVGEEGISARDLVKKVKSLPQGKMWFASPSHPRREGEEVSKPKKILLGAVTLWPLAYMLIFMVTVLWMFTMMGTRIPSRPDAGPPAWIPGLFIVHIGTMLLTLGLTIFYGIHAYRSNRVPESRRVIWVVLNILGSFIAQLFYWYLFIWREPEPLATTPPTSVT